MLTGKVNLGTDRKFNLFFLSRIKRLEHSEKPRKQVGHERGKFVCSGHHHSSKHRLYEVDYHVFENKWYALVLVETCK